MDPSALRQLGFFTVPNNQTINPLDQPFNAAGGQADPSGSLWDANTVMRGQGLSDSTSTAPTSLSPDFLMQPMSPIGQSSVPMSQSASSRSSVSGQNRRILPTRPSRTRDGHERKRSKLSSEATPFDSVDYWMQFDNDDSLADIPESMAPPTLESKPKNRRPLENRSINPARTLNTTASSSLQPTAARVEDFGDDSALDNALSEDEEDFSAISLADQLSKIDNMPPAEVPQREGLYSTPLSWERPQPGLRMDQLIGLTPPSLNEEEQRRLIAIAMNPGPSMGGLGSNLMYSMSSGFGTPLGSGFGTPAMSQVADPALLQRSNATSQARPAQPNQSKTPNSSNDKGKGNAKGGDRAAHNDIERKYRTNLKDRIAELKSTVPSLRTMADGDDDEPSQPGRAPKVSKGTVLTKATEYIHQLERRNKQIMAEHQTLSRRLQAFEQLLAAQAAPTFRVPDYSRALFDPRAFC